MCSVYFTTLIALNDLNNLLLALRQLRLLNERTSQRAGARFVRRRGRRGDQQLDRFDIRRKCTNFHPFIFQSGGTMLMQRATGYAVIYMLLCCNLPRPSYIYWLLAVTLSPQRPVLDFFPPSIS